MSIMFTGSAAWRPHPERATLTRQGDGKKFVR
jgi:hypothetical protein